MSSETLRMIVMLSPTLGAFHDMHSAHRSLRLTPAQQHMVRTRFRTWLRLPGRMISMLGGREDGPSAAYNDHGDRVHTYYVGGRRHGQMTRWYPSGQLKESCTYSDDVIQGNHQSWFMSGSIMWQCVRVNGNIRGERICYSPGGRLSVQESFCDGKLDGKSLTWHRSTGARQSESYYRHGQKHGMVTIWRTDGSLRCQTYYQAGRMHGESRQWAMDGVTLRSYCEYYNGVLVAKTYMRNHGRNYGASQVTAATTHRSPTG